MPPLISLIVQILNITIALSALVCFVDVLRRPADAFVAVGSQTKVFWLFILGLCAVVIGVGFSAIGIFGMLASVAVIFYLVDVRPKVKEITGRRY